jgi:hypothetical protein
MTYHANRLAATVIALSLLCLSSMQSAHAQRKRASKARQSKVTSVTKSQAATMAEITMGILKTASDWPDYVNRPKEDFKNLAAAEMNDLLNVLTLQQRQRFGVRARIVDPEEGIDELEKIQGINPDFINALRQQIRYLIAGDVQQAAAAIHPVITWYEGRTVNAKGPHGAYKSPIDYIPILKSQTGSQGRAPRESLAKGNYDQASGGPIIIHGFRPAYEAHNVFLGEDHVQKIPPDTYASHDCSSVLNWVRIENENKAQGYPLYKDAPPWSYHIAKLTGTLLLHGMWDIPEQPCPVCGEMIHSLHISIEEVDYIKKGCRD